MTEVTGNSDQQPLRKLATAICRAVDLAPIGVAVVDLSGALVAANGTLRRWGGGDREELPLGAALSPTGDIRRRLGRVASGEAVSFETARCELVPGVRGRFSVLLSPLAVADRILACSVFVTDEEVPAEVPDRPMHERFRDLVEGAGDGVIMARGNVLLYANRLLREWLALPGPEHVVGQLLTELFDGPTQPGISVSASGLYETALRRADGGEVPVVVSVAKVPLPEGATTVMVLRRRSPTRADVGLSGRQLERLLDHLERASDTLGVTAPTEGRVVRPLDDARERLADALALLREAVSVGNPAPVAVGRLSDTEAATAEARRPAPARGELPVVLVCDDESRLAMLTAGLLEQHGYASVTAGTGGDALVALRDRAVDVMLLDLNLPDGSANEVIAQMQQRALHKPVILTSGYAEEDVDPLLLRSPSVTGYLAKPYSVDRLILAIERALSARPVVPGLD